MKRYVVSKGGHLTREDVKRWLNNALLFSAPAIIVLLTSVVKQAPKDVAWGVLAIYVANLLIDLIRKYVKENHYVKK